jgi:transcriptional regulator GlxA family with amidase domain
MIPEKTNPPVARRGRPLSIPAIFLRELNELLRARGILLPVRAPQLPHMVSAKDREDDSRRIVSTRIGRVVELIDDELDACLSVDRLADEARLSKYHFSRVFREEIGETPWAYVRRARLRKAKDLLIRGASPAAAAIEAGFFDQSHLTRALRELEGTTPGQFQKEHARRTNADGPATHDRKNIQE